MEELKNMRYCAKCGHKMQLASSNTNQCHICEKWFCKRCRIGSICMDCAKHVPDKKLKPITFLSKFQNILMIPVLISAIYMCYLVFSSSFSDLASFDIIMIWVFALSIILDVLVFYLKMYKVQKIEEIIQKNKNNSK